MIVVNHNHAELLRHCLTSLLAQTYPCRDIIVVDNGSADHSVSVVSSFASRGVRLLTLSGNRGFSAAVNLGIMQSKGDLVALLNNDAVASKDWLKELVAGMCSDPFV